ncbi:DUF5133 domain-containing protein [Streptomyces sp. NPDC001858]
MIVPDPRVTRTLLTRYATLKIAQAERARPQTARELQDVTYTLCVLTGTGDVREAVAAADALLESAAAPVGTRESGPSLAVGGRPGAPVAQPAAEPHRSDRRAAGSGGDPASHSAMVRAIG